MKAFFARFILAVSSIRITIAIALATACANIAAAQDSDPTPEFDLAATATSSVLKNYNRIDAVIKLPEINGNLSGITYDDDTGTYFMIQNNYRHIFEYGPDFQHPLRVIEMIHLQDIDTEDIVYLGKGRFALSSEGNHILIFQIPRNATVLDMSTARVGVQEFTFPPPHKKNNGLEGVCYAPPSAGNKGTFYTVQEKNPKEVYTFPWSDSELDFKSPRTFHPTELFDAEVLLKNKMNDLSGCTFDKASDHLFLLSHESSRVMEFTRDGKPIASLNIPPKAPQYEGITFGPDQELILVSEPNTLIIMKKNH